MTHVEGHNFVDDIRKLVEKTTFLVNKYRAKPGEPQCMLVCFYVGDDEDPVRFAHAGPFDMTRRLEAKDKFAKLIEQSGRVSFGTIVLSFAPGTFPDTSEGCVDYIRNNVPEQVIADMYQSALNGDGTPRIYTSTASEGVTKH